MKRVHLNRHSLRDLIREELSRVLLEQDDVEDEDADPDEETVTTISKGDEETVGMMMSEDELNKILGLIWKFTRDADVDVREREKRNKQLQIVTGALVTARDAADDSDAGEAAIELDDKTDKEKLAALVVKVKKTNNSESELIRLGKNISISSAQ